MAARKSGARPRVLVLEDDELVGPLVRDRLLLFGYDASLVARGTDLMAELRRAPDEWDALVLDVQLLAPGEPEPRYAGDPGGLEVLCDVRRLGYRGAVVIHTARFAELHQMVSEQPRFQEAMRDARPCTKGSRTHPLANVLFEILFPDEHKERKRLDERHHLDELTDIEDVLEQVREAAYRGDENVLFYGEPGVGKEALVDYYFRHSPRVGELVRVAGEDLAGDAGRMTLLGCEKDFPQRGLAARPGAFERAGFGVVYVGDLGRAPKGEDFPGYSALSSKIRLEPDGYFNPQGSSTPHRVRCVTLATANLDVIPDAYLPRELRGLPKAESSSNLSQPILGRFVRRIHVPALRERPTDVARIARRLIVEDCHARMAFEASDLEPDPRELAPLLSHPLYGNWRDLQTWVVSRQLPDVDRPPPAPPPPEMPAIPSARAVLSLQLRLDADKRVNYSDHLGHEGHLKREYWTWLAVEHRMSLSQLVYCTGQKRNDVIKALKTFELPIPGE